MQTMTTTRLGRTGLEISRICLGCMSYGAPERGNHPWTIGEAASRPFIKKALDLGINFFDTANVYSDGSSEEIVGKALLDYAPPRRGVIATKVHGRMHTGPERRGPVEEGHLHRDRRQPEAARHRPRRPLPDPPLGLRVPIEETLEALNDVVRAGKALHIGASSMHAWQFAKALALSERHGWARFQTMQNYVNLLYREEEREMLPLCSAEGIGVIPWSPLARGRSPATGTRARPAPRPTLRQDALREDRRRRPQGGRGVAAVAARLDRPRAQVALAWVLPKPEVSAPIVGATRLEQLDDAVAALALQLSPRTSPSSRRRTCRTRWSGTPDPRGRSPSAACSVRARKGGAGSELVTRAAHRSLGKTGAAFLN
jgi:aryl-alcohol dehydrogenase-like predicted oxidoreductase